MKFETLPGTESFSAELEAELEAAVIARGPEWKPRTRHLRPDGTASYVNRLIRESSPYLLQHAHNPVNWSGWGDDALERARALGRPVLLSVGYSTCHWCHVMEEESFEDLEIAELMNRLCVPVKVDREVRPDVDHVYMQAVQALTGRGGWPMTVWLSPDGRPFFGGTYFPPRSGDRGMGTGFRELLLQIDEVWRRDGARVERSAEQLTEAIRRSAQTPAPGVVPGLDVALRGWQAIAADYDSRYGGFGAAPKFPMPPTLTYGLMVSRIEGSPGPLKMVAQTLEKMSAGGINDQLGGGFHRYSTDERWLVPHFEKMLHDQGLLTQVYLAAYQCTGAASLARVARETLDYVAAEMTAPSGAFYAATDADSEGEEGTFFVWTQAEIQALLGAEQARVFSAAYDVTARGNWEGKVVLNRPKPLMTVATALDMPISHLEASLSRSRAALYAARAKRQPPHLDDKQIVEWTAMMARAFAIGAQVLNEPRYASIAQRAVVACLGDGRVLRRLVGREEPGFLEDGAHLLAACLQLFETTGDPQHLQHALKMHSVLENTFLAADGAWTRSPSGGAALLVNDKPFFDGVVPSGNALMVENLLKLYAWTDHALYLKQAEATLRVASQYLTAASRAVPAMATSLARYHRGPQQVIVVTPNSGGGDGLREAVSRLYLPFAVVTVMTEAQRENAAPMAPVLKGKVTIAGKPTAYVCRAGACQLPTVDVLMLTDQLASL